MLDTSKIEYINLCTPYLLGRNLASFVTDISMRMYSVIYNKYIIIPVKSKVRNWGFDGSGEYCAKSAHYSFEKQEIDDSLDFLLDMDVKCDMEENRKLQNRFENIPLKERFKVLIKVFLYRMLGKYAFYYRKYLYK